VPDRAGFERSTQRTFLASCVCARRQIYVDVTASWSVFTDDPKMLRHILDSTEISKA
jgi:hypothetical protein